MGASPEKAQRDATLNNTHSNVHCINNHCVSVALHRSLQIVSLRARARARACASVHACGRMHMCVHPQRIDVCDQIAQQCILAVHKNALFCSVGSLVTAGRRLLAQKSHNSSNKRCGNASISARATVVVRLV
jgi:hypothetical protein